MPTSPAVMLAVPPRNTASSGRRGTDVREDGVEDRADRTVAAADRDGVDAVFRHFAQRLRDSKRIGDIAARNVRMGAEHAAHRRRGSEIRPASRIVHNAHPQRRQARCGVGRPGTNADSIRLERGRRRANTRTARVFIDRLADFREPGPDRSLFAPGSNGEQQPHQKNQRRQPGPRGDRQQADVGPADGEAQGEHDQVRIAPRHDQPEIGVERAPSEDGKRRDPALERAHAQAAADVTDEYDQVEQAHRDAGDHRGIERKADAPGHVPDGRMDEIDAVVEDISQPGRRDGDARELAVDGVEEGHDPTRQQSPPELAAANRTAATTTSTRLTAVTWLGVILMRTHQRVAHCAGMGHSHLVTRSVTPL
jgi:hypothetical protein